MACLLLATIFMMAGRRARMTGPGTLLLRTPVRSRGGDDLRISPKVVSIELMNSFTRSPGTRRPDLRMQSEIVFYQKILKQLPVL